MSELLVKAMVHVTKSFEGVMYGSESYLEGHLIEVYALGSKYNAEEDIRCALLLHDNLEDTKDTKKDLERLFNWNISNIVYNVTDGEGKNRKERKGVMYSRIKNSPEKLRIDSTFVKLIDRICNVREGGKIDMYRKEHKEFKKQLYRRGDKTLKSLWKMLDELLEER